MMSSLHAESLYIGGEFYSAFFGSRKRLSYTFNDLGRPACPGWLLRVTPGRRVLPIRGERQMVHGLDPRLRGDRHACEVAAGPVTDIPDPGRSTLDSPHEGRQIRKSSLCIALARGMVVEF